MAGASDKHQQELIALEEVNRQRVASLQQNHVRQVEELENRLGMVGLSVVVTFTR